MPAPFTNLIPLLLCKDVGLSVRFYCDTLGFEVINRMDDVGRSGYANLRQGRAQIMLASPTDIPEAPKVEGRYTQSIYYFLVTDVAALRKSVADAGHAPSPLRVTFYGMKEFEMTDPDGHMLWFGQETDEPLTKE